MKSAVIITLLVTIIPLTALAQNAAPTQNTDTTVKANKDGAKNNAETIKESKPSDGVPSTPPPSSPHNPSAPSMIELNSPSDSELSRANTELLAKNSELQGRIDELTTQVNVLVNERSGQLFLYGAVSTFVAFVTGLLLAFVISSKRK